MAKQLKVAIAGCGKIALEKHLPAVARIPEAQVTGFFDIDRDKAQRACEAYGPGQVYTDFKEMLDRERPDVVHVLTPNVSHAQLAIEAMKAGCHVMVEKPMASTLADSKEMMRVMRETGRVLTVGYQYRYQPDTLYLKKQSELGKFGEIYFARAASCCRRGVPTWGSFISMEHNGGGPLLDLGTHLLDMTLWVMNNYRPKYVCGKSYRKLYEEGACNNAFGDWDPAKFEVEDSAFGMAVMENGATVFVEAAWALNIREDYHRMQLCGTKAGAETRLFPGKPGIMKGLCINRCEDGELVHTYPNFYPGAREEQHPVRSEYSHWSYLEARKFYDHLLGRCPLDTTAEQAYVVSEILCAIYESSRTGKPVYFDQPEG